LSDIGGIAPEHAILQRDLSRFPFTV